MMDIPYPRGCTGQLNGSPAMRGAFRKGWEAYHAGKPRRHPYADRRTGHNNGVTFSAAFSRFWNEGWDAAQADSFGESVCRVALEAPPHDPHAPAKESEEAMNGVVAAVAILHNTGQDTYHPIIYRDAPLPGPSDPGTPRRLKSIGHHTSGFPSLAEAQENVRTDERMSGAVQQLEPPIAWEGADIPADVAFLEGNALVRF